MDVVNESSPAPRLRRAPFLVRLAPEFLRRLAAFVVAHEAASDQTNGVLFGLAEVQFAVVQVFRPFPLQPGGNERPGTKSSLQLSFDAVIANCKNDPELAGVKPLGWFSVAKAGVLQDEQIAFHQNSFSNLNDLALVIRNEPAGYLSFELYCRALDGSFSLEQNRWGLVRIPTGSPVVSPIEVTMRTKIHDDVYMRAYQFSESAEHDARVSGWKTVLASTRIKAFSRLKPLKPEDEGESVVRKRAREKPPVDELKGVTSMSEALQYAARGGSAAAPARIKEGRSESQVSVAESREDVQRTEPEEPPITDSRHPLMPVTPSQEVPAPQSEKHLTAAATTEPRAQALPSYSPAASQVLELDSSQGPSIDVPPGPAAELARLLTQSDRKLPWLALGTVFVVSTGATFGLIYLKDGRAHSTLPGIAQTAWASPGLHLRVSKSGERIQLSWNRALPAARNAQGAVLDIKDGPDHRQILLTAGEVANGSILYLPNTGEVVFRLEVHGSAGQNVSESMRVLNTRKSAKVGVNQTQKPLAETLSVKAGSSNIAIAANELQRSGTSSVDSAMLVPINPRDQGVANQDLRFRDQISLEKRKGVPPATPASSEATNTFPADAPAAHSTSPRETKPPVPRRETATPVIQQTGLPQPANPQRQGPALQGGQDRTVPGRSSASGESTPAPGNSPSAEPVTYRPPRPIKQVLPKVSALSASLGDAAGEVRVVVRVNESGRVVDARLTGTDDKVGPVLRAAAVSAAKTWVFAPASLRGKNVASDHTIVFHFRH